MDRVSQTGLAPYIKPTQDPLYCGTRYRGPYKNISRRIQNGVGITSRHFTVYNIWFDVSDARFY